jgi:hypothetical protein
LWRTAVSTARAVARNPEKKRASLEAKEDTDSAG